FSTTIQMPTTPLVGHWRMNENGGATLIDLSPYGNHAVIGTALWESGVEGQALRLDGTQFATVEDTSSLDITNSITITAWVKPEKRGTQNLVKKAVSGLIDGYELSLANTEGTVFFRINQASEG